MTYRCLGGIAVYVDGRPRVIPGGALVADDDPILKTHRAQFEPVETYTARVAAAASSPASAVETATAAPGEARTVVPPKPKPQATAPTTGKSDEK